MKKNKDEETVKQNNSKGFADNVKMYLEFKDTIKTLDKKCKELREDIMEVVKVKGATDEKGNIFAKDKYGNEIKIEKRTSVSLDTAAALEYCKKNGLTYCVEVITEERLNEDKFEIECKEGKVPDDVLESMVRKSSTEALKIEPAKE